MEGVIRGLIHKSEIIRLSGKIMCADIVLKILVFVNSFITMQKMLETNFITIIYINSVKRK